MRSTRTRFLAMIALAASCVAGPPVVVAQTVDLPDVAPVPEAGPEPDRDQPLPSAHTEIPLPEQRPKPGADLLEGQPKPDGPSIEAAPEKQMQADPRSGAPVLATMPEEEMQCRARLRALGVVFKEAEAQSDPAGCSLPYPLSVDRLGSTVSLAPAAVMNCAMAETVARFATSTVATAAQATYGSPLESIGHASAYVCKPRNGTRKLSEHAFGNALDIARFTLEDGTAIDVRPDPDPKAARLLDAVRKAACGPFKTVLGPGSDADHAMHLHFDLAPRRNGGTFCQ